MDMSSLETGHKKGDVATNRPSYREARWERAVKVYTVNQESKYLLVQNVHALGVTEELMQLFSLYGSIEEYRLLDEYPCEPYTDVYWIKFTKIDAARLAKKKTDNHSFFGKNLHVCYAPEYETVNDTREKLQQRRKVIAAKTRDKPPAPLMETDPRTQSLQTSEPSQSTTAMHGIATEPILSNQSRVSEECPEFSQVTVSSSILAPTLPQNSQQSPGLLSLPILPTPPQMSPNTKQSYPSMTKDEHTLPSTSLPAHKGRAQGTRRAPQHNVEAGHGLSKDERVSMYFSTVDDPLQSKQWSTTKARVHKGQTSEQLSKASGPEHGSHEATQPSAGVSHDLPMTGDKSVDASVTAIRKKMNQVQQPGSGGPVTKKRRRI